MISFADIISVIKSFFFALAYLTLQCRRTCNIDIYLPIFVFNIKRYKNYLYFKDSKQGGLSEIWIQPVAYSMKLLLYFCLQNPAQPPGMSRFGLSALVQWSFSGMSPKHLMDKLRCVVRQTVILPTFFPFIFFVSFLSLSQTSPHCCQFCSSHENYETKVM